MTPRDYWQGWRLHGVAFIVVFWTVGYFVLRATR
jgi:hypothetical protein